MPEQIFIGLGDDHVSLLVDDIAVEKLDLLKATNMIGMTVGNKVIFDLGEAHAMPMQDARRGGAHVDQEMV